MVSGCDYLAFNYNLAFILYYEATCIALYTRLLFKTGVYLRISFASDTCTEPTCTCICVGYYCTIPICVRSIYYYSV